ncbi:Pectate lyase [Treponema berlinense]|uniref:Pectate lyase n=1 Tax=Treponema berlinense TaxID=225004 RepID=A0A1T4Q0P7_9SPIR|nr:polysaccharide lyase family 1 protein [Treponema berlinense]SJZ97363.1 Pectate lyase [Treponema berlinense]
MKKNSQKRKFGTILLSLAALFAVLFSTAACKTDSDDDELNSVTINPSEATINANGQISLYADVDRKGSGTPVYKWEITSGDDYATLENATSATCVVTGKNTTASAQRVTVKCTVTFASTTKEAEATVTVSTAKVELESVSIAGSAEIESTANTELTATPAFTIKGASPTVTYTWTISAGREYAELSESTTGTIKLTANNTTTEAQTVTVKVTAAYDGTTKEATKTVKILARGQVVENKVTSVSVSAEKSSIACDGSTTLTATPVYSGNPEITYTWTISSGSEYAELSESTTGTATLTAKNTTTAEQTVKVKVSASDGTNSVESTCEVTVGAAAAVETGNVIKASDTPLGFAGVNYAMPTFTNVVTVKTRNELMKAINNENSLIYIDGMIDMSDEGNGSKLPAEGASNIAVSSVMDSWIASKTSNAYKTYAAWVEAYAAVCEKSTDDKEVGNSGNSSLCKMVWTLNNAWKSVIQLKLNSNTTIIGLGNNSGIRGGTISINGIKNVVIRNLTLVDAIDMFPHHEVKSKGESDGFNAQFDCITIQGSNTANIWIDHCTMKDTLVMQHVQSGTKEKWQNYDGLCDIKGDGKGITVSNCHMYHHDKTMLVGSDDNEGDNTVRKLSIINNHFDTCVQRLPMARNSQFHVLNNWYTFGKTQSVGDGKTKGDYCIGARKGALIYSEANYFDSNMQYSIRGNEKTASMAKVYDTGSVDKNTKKTDEYTAVDSAPFTVPYSYEPMTAENAKTYVAANAGAGVWTVVK